MAGTTHPLNDSRNLPWAKILDAQVDVADVYTKLQRRRSHYPVEVSSLEPVLHVVALLPREGAVVHLNVFVQLPEFVA